MTDRSSQLRVLMTADAMGGVWTYALQLAAATEPHGCEFVLAVMGPEPSAAQVSEVAALPNVRLEISPFRLEWMPDPWEDVDAAGTWLLELAARHGVDLVHLNGYAHGSLPFGVPTLVVGHSCVCSWWSAVHREEPPQEWNVYRARVAAGIVSADAVVAPTAWMLEELRRHYGRLSHEQVIPNGRAMRAPPAAKEPFVLAAGRLWDQAKNTRVLAAVARSLPWRCFVAGEEHGPAPGEESYDGIVRLGKLPAGELAGWMSRAAIFAHPARYEPFGLAPLEAALAGCALVLGDIPSLREVWDNAAVYVDPRDATAWAAALRGLITRPLERERRAIACRKRAARYSRERFGSAYAGLYAELTRRATRHVPVERARTAAAT